MLDRLRSGGVDGLIVMGHDVLDAAYLGGVELLTKLDTLIVLDTHHSALERVAHVLLPVRVAAEKHGTLTNFAGRVQKIQPAVEPTWEALDDGEVLTRSARRSASRTCPRAGTSRRARPGAEGASGLRRRRDLAQPRRARGRERTLRPPRSAAATAPAAEARA